MEKWLAWALMGGFFLWLAWTVLQMVLEPIRKQRDELYVNMMKGMGKSLGWVSVDDAIQFLERGGCEYGQLLEAARVLGEVAVPHPDLGVPPPEIVDKAVRALTHGLEYQDARVRTAAAVSLGRIGNPAAIPALHKALEAPGPTQDEIQQHKANVHQRDFLKGRARREGVSTPEVTVSDPTEEHSQAREAVAWALHEINRRS